MTRIKTRSLRQTATFKATPHEVYEALMDSRKHAKFTGGQARISRRVGGRFSTYDGYAEGENVELIPNEKIVQTWRASDWPEGHYSQVTFSLATSRTGTRLTLVQTGIPNDQYNDIKQGWIDYYWKPMKEMLE
jgi:activator of HSP90 ATPase